MDQWLKTESLKHKFEILEVFQPHKKENSELQSIQGVVTLF